MYASPNVFQQVIKVKQDEFKAPDEFDYQFQKPDIDLSNSYLSLDSPPSSPPPSTISSKSNKSNKKTVPQAQNSQFIIGKNKVVNGVYTLIRRRSKYTLNHSK